MANDTYPARADGGRPFQILCLSGGGYLGLYSIAVLRRLEDKIGEPIGRCFDLIAGTSVGGIVALGLASGASAAAIEAQFLADGDKIFSATPVPASEGARKRALALRLLRFRRAPIYASAPLLKTIRAIVPEGLLMSELETRVIVPAINLSKGKPQVFKTPHHPSFKNDLNLAVEDIALATSAAPTFFPTHRIGAEVFADGGLYANSPDQLAIHEAAHFIVRDMRDIRMLSIGTTSTSFSWSAAMKQDLGWLDWALDQRLLRAMMAGQQINADYILRHLLGERYVRIDAVPSHEQAVQLVLDNASAVAKQDLEALATASAREFSAHPMVQAMLAHRAGKPQFFNLTKPKEGA